MRSIHSSGIRSSQKGNSIFYLLVLCVYIFYKICYNIYLLILCVLRLEYYKKCYTGDSRGHQPATRMGKKGAGSTPFIRKNQKNLLEFSLLMFRINLKIFLQETINYLSNY